LILGFTAIIKEETALNDEDALDLAGVLISFPQLSGAYSYRTRRSSKTYLNRWDGGSSHTSVSVRNVSALLNGVGSSPNKPIGPANDHRISETPNPAERR